MNGNFDKIPSYDSGLLYTVQKNIPAVKNIYKKVIDWKNSENVGSNQDTKKDFNEISIESYKLKLNEFLKRMADIVEKQGSKLIIFYHVGTKIGKDGNLVSTTNFDYLNCFEKACMDNNIVFVDMEKDFKDLYTNEFILPYGFSNTSVGVGHLNKYGHKLIAERLAQVIKE